MAGILTCDRESQVQRPNHYTTEPHSESMCGELMVYQIRLQSLTSLNVTRRLKMQDRKMTNQIAGVENNGPDRIRVVHRNSSA